MLIDCLFISNYTNDENKIKLVNAMGSLSNNGYSRPLLSCFKSSIVSGIITLDFSPNELFFKTGFTRARKLFISALKNAIPSYNPSTILLAASTKRLFGKNCELKINENGLMNDNASTLNELFPDILFTNGDNGTSLILNLEIKRVLENLRNENKDCHVMINGLGLLGTDSLEYLIENELNDNQIIVISEHSNGIKEIIKSRNIKIYSNPFQIPLKDARKINFIINCTHNPKNMIRHETINYLQNGSKIYVIDVAVPYGFPESEYLQCKNVYRQDGGNAYIAKELKYFYNPDISGLSENIVYGCFAEALALSLFIKDNPNEKQKFNQYDFFNVNTKTKRFIAELFSKYGITAPIIPLNYNKLKTDGKLEKILI